MAEATGMAEAPARGHLGTGTSDSVQPSGAAKSPADRGQATPEFFSTVVTLLGLCNRAVRVEQPVGQRPGRARLHGRASAVRYFVGATPAWRAGRLRVASKTPHAGHEIPVPRGEMLGGKPRKVQIGRNFEQNSAQPSRVCGEMPEAHR